MSQESTPTSPKLEGAYPAYLPDRANEAAQAAMKRIKEQVAFDAIFDSPERKSSPRCLPGTRQSFLKSIEQWASPEAVASKPQICIVRGPSGSGKSAILQSAAERFSQMGIPSASFFWNTALGHKECNVIPTLAYQIANANELTKSWITKSMGPRPVPMNPYEAGWLLLSSPMMQMDYAPPRNIVIEPITLVLDGLEGCFLDEEPPDEAIPDPTGDEGHKARHIITNILDSLLGYSRRGYFRLLISLNSPSKFEDDLRAYTSRGETTFLSLMATTESESDIQSYLTHHIKRIRKKYPSLPSTWSSPDIAQELLRRSYGFFNYPALVMHYIAASGSDPAKNLRSVMNIKLTPDVPNAMKARSALDALYIHILRNVSKKSWRTLISILELLIVEKLKYRLFTDIQSRSTVAFIARCLFLTPREVSHQLKVLRPILNVSLDDYTTKEDSPIPVVDPSFSSFLMDQSRSGEFFINHADAHIHIQLNRLKHAFIQALTPDGGKSLGYTPDGFANSLRREFFVAPPEQLPPPVPSSFPPPFPASMDLAHSLSCFTSPNDDVFLDFARQKGFGRPGPKVQVDRVTVVSHFLGEGPRRERTSKWIEVYNQMSVSVAEEKAEQNQREEWWQFKQKAQAVRTSLRQAKETIF